RRRDERRSDRAGRKPIGLRRRFSMAREIEFLNPPELMKPVGFSHAAQTRGGRTLFLAGQVAKDRDGRVVGKGDLVAQFRQVCDNLKTLVAAAGGDRKSTRLNSSHVANSYAVFCLKKKGH